MANPPQNRPLHRTHNVATSVEMRTPIGFARMVSPEERSWCETHSLGHEFLLAANYLNSDSRPSHLAPTFVLYIHAIEMALKSYTFTQGFDQAPITTNISQYSDVTR
jgi:hypothetical protein